MKIILVASFLISFTANARNNALVDCEKYVQERHRQIFVAFNMSSFFSIYNPNFTFGFCECVVNYFSFICKKRGLERNWADLKNIIDSLSDASYGVPRDFCKSFLYQNFEKSKVKRDIDRAVRRSGQCPSS